MRIINKSEYKDFKEIYPVTVDEVYVLHNGDVYARYLEGILIWENETTQIIIKNNDVLEKEYQLMIRRMKLEKILSI